MTEQWHYDSSPLDLLQNIVDKEEWISETYIYGGYSRALLGLPPFKGRTEFGLGHDIDIAYFVERQKALELFNQLQKEGLKLSQYLVIPPDRTEPQYWEEIRERIRKGGGYGFFSSYLWQKYPQVSSYPLSWMDVAIVPDRFFHEPEYTPIIRIKPKPIVVTPLETPEEYRKFLESKQPWPQPPLETRKEVVSLIERGKHDEAVEILRKSYNIPRPIRVMTPRQLLSSRPECLEEWFNPYDAFMFSEWEELKRDFPLEFEEFRRHYEDVVGFDLKELGMRKVGWWLMSEFCPYDLIIVSEKYFLHPAITIHEFSHILWHYVKAPPIPDTGPLSQPETWDRWTRDFLTDVRPEPWFPWSILPMVVLSLFFIIPLGWGIAWQAHLLDSG